MAYQAIYYDRKSNRIHLWDDKNGYASIKHKPYAYRRAVGGKYKSIFGQELEKVEQFRYGDPSLFSSDIPVETRTLVDVYGDSDEPSTNHRIAILDIEVDSTHGYPNVAKPTQKITAISLYDAANDHYYCLVLDEDGVVESKKESNRTIISFLTEEDLLTEFISKWRAIDPTIATGWNTDGFDFPYLHARLVAVFDDNFASGLSPINICYWNKYKNKMTIAGVNCLDYLLLYKRFSGKSLPNYRLDSVGKEELKVGKVEFEGSLDHLKKTNINKFIEYSFHDVVLVKGLNDLLQFIELAMSTCHVCHVGYEEFSVPSKYLEGALLTYLRRKNLVAPNKKLDHRDEYDFDTDPDDDEVGFVGAYVKDPVPGRYEWVCSADINSLYPSVIMSLNISPETKLGVIPDWSSEKLIKKTQDKFTFFDDEYTYEEFSKAIVENNLSVSANGVVYDQNKIGCIPDILKKWFAERVEFKNKMKDCDEKKDKEGYVFWKRRQQVQKILLNSLYGCLGLPIWRFYDVDNASAVTLTGQEIIKTSAKYVNNKFNKRCDTTDKDYVIYIDTDSLYLDINSLILAEKPADPKAFAIQTVDQVSKELNEFYKVMMPRMFNSTDNRIKIAADTVAKAAFWIVKKRYAMWKVYSMELGKDEDAIEVKGLDVVRSSYPKKFRDFMNSVLSDILKGTDNKALNKKVTDFKSTMKDFNLEDVAKNTSVRFISKTDAATNFDPPGRDPFNFIQGSTAQCKASLAYNDILRKNNLEETEPIMSGGKIKWVYLRKNPLGLSGLAFKDDGRDPKIIMDFITTYIDRTAIWDAELEKKLKAFYEALRWDIYSDHQEVIDQFLVFDS